jgi:MinD superfamily P-loop ATPase
VSIKDRMRRLEKENERSCQECRETPQAIHVVYPGEQEPDPEYCPGCGRPLGVVIRVVYDR